MYLDRVVVASVRWALIAGKNTTRREGSSAQPCGDLNELPTYD